MIFVACLLFKTPCSLVGSATDFLPMLLSKNASLREGLMDLQKELDLEKELFRAHFASRGFGAVGPMR